MLNNQYYDFLKSNLQIGQVLYITKHGTGYTFIGWGHNGALRFAIPSRTLNKKANVKNISREVLIGDCKPNFSDCRLTVFNALIKP